MRPLPSRPPPRDVQRIVESQVRKWRIERDDRASLPDAELPWPVVTVSREHGSLGSAVAARAAEVLGFSFWDQELVQLIAEQTGAEQTLVASLDERTRTGIEDFISELLMGIDGSVAEYVRHVARVVRTFERHGSAVVVGRGAQFIIAPGICFRVRVVCPEEIRAARIAALHGLGEKEAIKHVRAVERERIAFIRRHYSADVNDPSHYDLVINTGHVDVAAGAEILAACYGAKFPAPREAIVEIPERAVDSAPFHPKPEP